jgi:uncharacterized damage-inducible protein DinB
MAEEKLPEFWQRGPVEGITPLLQPVAHALLQAQAEIHTMLEDRHSDWFLWRRTYGLASPAFHIQHIIGVLDRLFTYAKGDALTKEQLHYLSLEGKENEAITFEILLRELDKQIEKSLFQLRETDGDALLEPRGIGRKQIPTNVLGLLFHAAEHTMRHTGQLLVTIQPKHLPY